jgi:hypothetical protein
MAFGFLLGFPGIIFLIVGAVWAGKGILWAGVGCASLALISCLAWAARVHHHRKKRDSLAMELANERVRPIMNESLLKDSGYSRESCHLKSECLPSEFPIWLKASHIFGCLGFVM